MQRLRNTLRRIFSASLPRLRMCVARVKQETGRSGLLIFGDMLRCYLRLGIGYLDYVTFGFAHQDGRHRRTFMTMNLNLALVRALNDPAERPMLDDKLAFNRHFSALLGRDFVDIRESGADGLSRFIRGKRRIFAKRPDGFGGKGVSRIEVDGVSGEELYRSLAASGQFDAEEALVQHEVMNRLAGNSVNSLRMVTLRKDKKAHLLYTLVRMGDGVSAVDNISSGGMYCPVDGSGVITAPAFRDYDARYYDRHPVTGTLFEGFSIPFYQKAAEMALRAAETLPGLRYVGWDIAITPDGPALIEGNTIPGYDMCQNYRHLGPDKEGVVPRFGAILGDEMPALRGSGRARKRAGG